MEQPKPLTPEEIEINQAKYLAWQEAALSETEQDSESIEHEKAPS